MNTYRKSAIIAGIVFIIATAASLLSTAFTGSFQDAPDYLSKLAANQNQIMIGVLLLLVAAFGSAGIAIAMYPVMKESNTGLALGSVVFRALEAVFYMVGIVSLLSLLTLSQQFTTAGAAEAYDASGHRQCAGERTRPRRAGGGVRLLPGRIYVLHPVLPITAHSPLAVGLRHRRDHPDAGRVRAVLVQRRPYHQLHSPGVSHFLAGDGSRCLADR